MNLGEESRLLTDQRAPAPPARRSWWRRVFSAGVVLAAAAAIPAARADIRTSTLMEHCSGPGKPDGMCLGYMEAALDFIVEYQLWLGMKGYDFPPSDRAVCIFTGHPALDVATTFVAWVLRHPSVADQRAAVVVGDSIREAFPCK